MIDRQGRIVFGSLLAFVLVLTVSTVVEFQFGTSLREYPVLSFLIFAGVAVAAPQLYLAATDDDTWTRERIQFVTVATAVFAIVFAADAEGLRYLLISAIGTCSLLGLLCYEALRWHRETTDEAATQVQ